MRAEVLRRFPLRFDFLAEGLDAERLHQDLDASLVNVVAAAVAVVHAQRRFEVREQILQRQELTQHRADDRRATEAATDEHRESDAAVRIALHVQADVVDFGSGTIVRRTGHGDLEFARQVRELGVQRGPLTQDLAVRTRIVQLIRRDAGEVIGGDVADAIAARLDRMHLHAGEVLEDIGHVLQLGPVELQILARREVAVALVVRARDERELAQLLRCSEGHKGRRCEASAPASGCTDRCGVEGGGIRLRTARRPGTDASDHGIQPRAGRPPPGRSRRSDTYGGEGKPLNCWGERMVCLVAVITGL